MAIHGHPHQTRVSALIDGVGMTQETTNTTITPSRPHQTTAQFEKHVTKHQVFQP